MNTEYAVDTLRKALKKDKDLYKTYECTIALQFFDEFNRSKIRINQERLMKIARKAAQNYLDLFIE